MALKIELDSLDGLDEAVKGLYVQDGDKYRLDAELPDVAGLKSALDKERKAAREAEQARKRDLERYKDIDPERYAELLKAHEELEEAKLKGAGNIDELVAKKAEKAIAEAQKQLKAAQDAAEAAKQRAHAYESRVLDDSIRAAAAKAGLHQHAIDDALFRGRAMFVLDENGNAVQRDAEGNTVIGKDGKTPYSPIEWLESMRETAPHWFPAGASGSGSGSGKQGGGFGSGKPRSEWSPREKADYIEKHGRAAYEALPYN